MPSEASDLTIKDLDASVEYISILSTCPLKIEGGSYTYTCPDDYMLDAFIDQGLGWLHNFRCFSKICRFIYLLYLFIYFQVIKIYG